MKFLPRLFSWLFHPLLMPSFGVLIFLNLNTYISYTLTFQFKAVIFSVILLNTFIVPALFAISLKKSGIISNLEMNVRKERTLPFLLTAVFYFISYYLLSQKALPGQLLSLILGAAICIVFAMVLNTFFKISIHMIGIGGLAGGVLGFSLLMGINTYQLLIFIFLISGLVGFSRLALDAHKPLEVYTGFIAGFLIEYLSVAKLIG
jgi:hypothetical protein